MPNDSEALDHLLETIPSLVFIKDRENRILRVNRAALASLGMPRSEVEGRRAEEIDADRGPLQHAADLSVLDSGEPRLGVTERVGDLWTRTDRIPMRSAEGELDRVLVVSTPAAPAGIVESSPTGMLLVDRRGRILLVNAAAAEMLGYERKDLLGHGVEDLVPEALRGRHAELRAAFFDEPIARRMGEGRELFAVRANGDEFPVQVGLSPVSTEFGDCVIATIADTSQQAAQKAELASLNEALGRRVEEADAARQQAEGAEERLAGLVERLATSEERFRTLFDVSPVMTVNARADRVIQDCNRRVVERLGYSDKSELVGRSARDLYDESCRDEADDAFTDLLQSGKIGNVELTLRTKTGVRVPVVLDAVAVRDARGEFLYSASTLSDLTEIHRYAAELKRANEDLEQFARAASHDLKSPLRGIAHLVDWIDEDARHLLPERTLPHLDQLRQRAQRLSRLLEDLLAYYRAGAREGRTEAVDLDRLLDDVTELTDVPEGFVIERRLSLTSVRVRRAALETVLRNLLGNAIKHHDRERGVVVVEATAAPGRTEFAITDDGPGISPRFRDKAFSMFQTLRPRDDVEGSGVGLALVKRVVQAEGGRVWVEDAQPRGARVRVDWPTPASGGD